MSEVGRDHGVVKADETTLVKRFIHIADAANADHEIDLEKTVDALIPIVWYLTCFVPTPSFLDQQVRDARFDVLGVSCALPEQRTHASLLAHSWLHERS